MENKQLKQDMIEHKEKKEFPFWSLALIAISLLHGEFIIRVCGYLSQHSEPYLGELPENTIGAILIGLALVKLIALIFDRKKIQKITIWGLSFIWTGLFFVSLTYSFGTGHPNPDWYFYALVVVSCYRVSLEGGF